MKSGDNAENIVFHGLHDTISALSTQLFNLSNEYKSDEGLVEDTIFSKVSGYGYIDISSATLDEALDDCQDFVQNQIDDRIEYLKSLVQTVLQTARDLKSQYIAARTTFTDAVNSYDNEYTDEKITSRYIYTVCLNTLEKGKGCDWDGYFTDRTKDPGKARSVNTKDVVQVMEGDQVWYYFSKKESP